MAGDTFDDAAFDLDAFDTSPPPLLRTVLVGSAGLDAITGNPEMAQLIGSFEMPALTGSAEG
jgi:hypothetical protein